MIIATTGGTNLLDAPVGFSFELDQSDYELPAECRRQAPYLVAHTFKGPQRQIYYWDVDRWEAAWKKQHKR